MALVKCKECGAQVSTKAERCASCGAPLPKPRVRVKAVLWATAAIVLFPFVLGPFYTEQGAKPPPPSDGAPAAQAVGIGAPAGNETEQAAAGAVHLDDVPTRKIVSVSVKNLHAEYDENEVAADILYGNSLVKIHGYVVSIDMSLTNKPVVRIGAVEDPYRIVVAQLDDTEKNGAAKLVKGQEVYVLCEHIRRLISSLAGYKCILLDKETAESIP